MLRLLSLALCAGVLGLASPAAAVDGQIIITQAKAMAGGITPGDGPNFPIAITQPGSYKLGSDLIVTAGRNGVLVAASNVTLDLNGFMLHGQGGAALSGIIIANKPLGNLVVRNGKIWDFKSLGIDAARSNFGAFEELQVFGNLGGGISVGSYTRISRNVISANLGLGVACAAYCHVESNVVSGNRAGIKMLFGTVLGNTIQFNAAGLGVEAEMAGAGNNTLFGNEGPGGAQVSGVFPMQPNFCEPECTYSAQAGASPQAAPRPGASF